MKVHTRKTVARAGAISFFTVILLMSLFLCFKQNNNSQDTSPLDIQAPTATNTHPVEWSKISIKRHETLSRAFQRNGIPYTDLALMLKSSLAAEKLNHLQPGQIIHFTKDADGHVSLLQVALDDINTLYLTKYNTHYDANIKTLPLTSALLYKQGTVNHSFMRATRHAGLTAGMTAQLKEIFQGSINFDKSIRKGDQFSILYKEYFLKGKRYKPGNIIAATFKHKGKNYRAIRYTYPNNHTGYYTLDGHGVEPLFLKKPLHYKRISSFFAYHRMDPYLHKVHSHLGVDFAAKAGTPIRSIGDGVVSFHGRDGGYGNAVIIRYGKKYKALYGHMQRFAANLHNHQRVMKGQIIGYVGQTGWATGPHLHFSFYVNGVAKDPLKIKFPGGKSVPKSYLDRYLAYAKMINDQLNLYEGPQLAENGDKTELQ